MRLLEITTEVPSALVCEAHELQRERLAQDYDLVHLDLRGKSQLDRSRAVDMAKVPDVVLLRGISDFYAVGRAFPRAKLIVDHCTHEDLGLAPRGQHILSRATVFCYSAEAQTRLRAAGARKTSVLPGPWLRDLREPRKTSGGIYVGFVPTPWAKQALLDTLRDDRERRRDALTYYSADRVLGAVYEPDATAMAVVCDVLVYAQESEDLGAPHEGAMLAAAYGCGLVSVALSSLDAAGFEKDAHYALALKYVRGGYARGLEAYTADRDTLDRGVLRLKYDPDAFHVALRRALT